jgi:hypothetical protein
MLLYAAAREEANQDYYTKAPATWLANECWNDDPRAHALGSKHGEWKKAMTQFSRRLADQPPNVTPKRHKRLITEAIDRVKNQRANQR